jgi:hypothetical protein
MVGDPTVAGFLMTARENEIEVIGSPKKYLVFLERVEQKFRGLIAAGTGDNVVARIMVLASHAYYLPRYVQRSADNQQLHSQICALQSSARFTI